MKNVATVLYELMELHLKDVATVLYELMEQPGKMCQGSCMGSQSCIRKMWLQCCMSSWSCQGKCAKGLV
jgi:hypothetical protein